MWIEREITPELQRIAETFPALVLVGPRQVGKTAVMEKTFPAYRYVSLDVGVHAETAETRPQDFLRKIPPPLIIDEIQYAPSFFKHIKTVIDERRGENGLFLLTGSQNFMLMEKVADSLAGRAAVIPFSGLSGREWQNAASIRAKSSFREFLWKGGFPALWSNPESAPSRDRWYQGYVATYLERDIRNLLNVGSLWDFERFLRACAGRCGQTLNLTEVGRDVGISGTTVKHWLSALIASNQVFLLKPYHRSLGKRIAKSPKLYFQDTGLAAYLMGFDSADALFTSMYAGALWENHVINQWVRFRDWRAPSLGLWYWRDQAGNEVDLLIEKNGKLTGVECKLSTHPGRKAGKGLRALRKFYGDAEIDRAFVACPVDLPFALGEEVTATPGWTVWES